jgi:hypothetical protein
MQILLLLTLIASASSFLVAPAQTQDWLNIENEFFTVKYHAGYEADANLTLSTAMIVRNMTLEKYPHTLSFKVLIYIYTDPQEIGGSAGISEVGSNSATIKILRPSWNGSWGGYEQLDNPFRRVLNHEYVHVPFYVDLYSKPSGYSHPPSWFNQGIAEYISQNYLPSYEERVREDVKTNIFPVDEEPYSWGLYIVEFMYNQYGQQKTVNLIKSSAPTFNLAIMTELNETSTQFEGKWQTYLLEKFEVSPSPSPPPVIPEMTPLPFVAFLVALTCFIALSNVKYTRRKNA